MNSFSFGQYYPSDSLLHRLDPRCKVLLAVFFIVCTFLCKTLPAYLFLFATVLVLIAISRIPFKTVLSSLKAMLFILIFTAFVNIFFTQGDNLLVNFSLLGLQVNIYLEGLKYALFMFIRLFSLIVGMGLFLTYTTTPLDMTDALEWVLSPLKKIKVPVHIFAMMMSITLRFIPTLSEETQRIMNAQRARGNSLTTGSFIHRVKAFIPILVPLFVSSINRALDLACAMECRCYTDGEGRTKLHVLHFTAKDIVAFALGLVFLGIILLTNTL